MGKIVMTLHLPEARVRKKSARPVHCHKDKAKYCRKAKHKGPWLESHGPFLFLRKPDRHAALAPSAGAASHRHISRG